MMTQVIKISIHTEFVSQVITPEWVLQHLPEGGLLCLASPCNTGKGTLAKLLADYMAKKYPLEAQNSPSHRVALVEDQARRLGWGTYHVDPKAQKVCTTFNSLPKSPTWEIDAAPGQVLGLVRDRSFSYINLDEIAQCLRYLTSNPIGRDAPQVIAHLQALLKARLVGAMDADLCDETIELLQLLAPGRPILYVVNSWRPEGRAVQLYDDQDQHLTDFYDDVKAGLKVAYLSAGSADHAEYVARECRRIRPGSETRIRVYSMDTSKLPEVQKDLANMDEAILKYDVIVSTPTLGSGVDISVKDYIDRVYLHVPAHDVGADDAAQLAWRFRHPRDKTWRVYLESTKRSRETEPARIRRDLLDVKKLNSATQAKVYKDSPLVKLIPGSSTELMALDDLHLELYCRAWAHVHQMSNDLVSSFTTHMEEAGFTVHPAVPLVSEDAANGLKKAKEDRAKALAQRAQAKAKGTKEERKEAAKAAKDALDAERAAKERVDSERADAGATREARKLAKVEIKDERAQRIASAGDVDLERADEIERARAATRAEQDSAIKARIVHFYGIDELHGTQIPNIDVDQLSAMVREDDRGRLRPQVVQLAVHLIHREGKSMHGPAMVRDLKRAREGLTARSSRSYLASALLAKVLPLYGVKGPVEDHLEPLVPVANFRDHIAKLLPLIKLVMGITPRFTNDRDVDAISLFRVMLKRFGLGTIREEKSVANKKVRTYYIDQDLAKHRIQLAQASVARIHAGHEELLAEGCLDGAAQGIDQEVAEGLYELLAA